MKLNKKTIRNARKNIGIISFNDVLYKINASRGTIIETNNPNNVISIDDLPEEAKDICYELIALWQDNYQAINKI